MREDLKTHLPSEPFADSIISYYNWFNIDSDRVSVLQNPLERAVGGKQYVMHNCVLRNGIKICKSLQRYFRNVTIINNNFCS